MGLSIFFKGGVQRVLELPLTTLRDVDINYIEYILANGKELDKIVDLYVGVYDNVLIPTIPLAKNTLQQIWYGDIAKTIVANLK